MLPNNNSLQVLIFTVTIIVIVFIYLFIVCTTTNLLHVFSKIFSTKNVRLAFTLCCWPLDDKIIGFKIMKFFLVKLFSIKYCIYLESSTSVSKVSFIGLSESGHRCCLTKIFQKIHNRSNLRENSKHFQYIFCKQK